MPSDDPANCRSSYAKAIPFSDLWRDGETVETVGGSSQVASRAPQIRFVSRTLTPGGRAISYTRLRKNSQKKARSAFHRKIGTYKPSTALCQLKYHAAPALSSRLQIRRKAVFTAADRIGRRRVCGGGAGFSGAAGRPRGRSARRSPTRSGRESKTPLWRTAPGFPSQRF